MDVRKASHELLRKNRLVTDGHQYTIPSPDTYPYQWLWDSCFHAIVLAELEPEAAKAELRSLVSRQLPDRMIPHIIYWEPGTLARYQWGIEGTSAITQPPMLAYAAWRIYEATQDLAFLRELSEPMMRFFHYLIDTRDPQDHHLIGIINPDESGEDNSSRFDSILHVPSDISIEGYLERRLALVDANRACNFDAELCMRQHFWVKDVPINAILVENLRVMEKIARQTGDAAAGAYCKEHADLITEAMRDLLFEGGVYWSADGISYDKLRVATWAHFAPLFAGLYTQEEAAALVERHFMDETSFRSAHGIRTVSKAEASYRVDGFWRGPIWMAPHWFIYRGLRRYGFDREARWIRERSLGLIEQSGFREYFNPETGKGYGAHDFTWGTLVLDMLD